MNLMDKLNQKSNLSTYNNLSDNNIEKVNINKLKIIENQFFKEYKGERYDILKDSIKNVGIITPLIVRKLNDEYIILSGRHRYNVAKELNITEIPCIIKYNISDDDANLILIDSNLAQRDKLLPSELSKSFKLKNEIMNRKGFRSDLFDDKNKGKTTLKIIAEEYNMSGTMIFNYIKLSNLIPNLLDMVDNEKIAFSVGVILSDLDKKNQQILNDYVNINNIKITISIAKKLKEFEQLNNDILNETFKMNKTQSNKPKISKALATLTLDGYFDNNTSDVDIISTIKKALDLYLNNK